VLEQFLQVVEPEQIEALVADREFTGTDFLRKLKEREVPFVIRIKTDRRLGPPSGETSAGDTCARDWSLPVRIFARTCQPGQSRFLEGEQALGGAKSVERQVAMKRLEKKSKDNSEEDSF